MTTIAERHHLQRGDLCEIVVVRQGFVPGGAAHKSYTRYGKYMFTRGNGELYFDQGEREPYRVSEEHVRSVRKVTEADVARQCYPSQKVYVRKYGSDYFAEIIRVGRTRVEIQFTTKGGKVKRQMFPAWQVWS